jgi:hypothetical protein
VCVRVCTLGLVCRTEAVRAPGFLFFLVRVRPCFSLLTRCVSAGAASVATTMAGEPVTSDLFESYQNDYNTLSAAVSRRINSHIPSLAGGACGRPPPTTTTTTHTQTSRSRGCACACVPPEKKKEAVRTAERELDEVEELVRRACVSRSLVRRRA